MEKSEPEEYNLLQNEKRVVFQYYNIFSKHDVNQRPRKRNKILDDPSKESFDDRLFLKFLMERIKRKKKYERSENRQETKLFIKKFHEIHHPQQKKKTPPKDVKCRSSSKKGIPSNQPEECVINLERLEKEISVKSVQISGRPRSSKGEVNNKYARQRKKIKDVLSRRRKSSINSSNSNLAPKIKTVTVNVNKSKSVKIERVSEKKESVMNGRKRRTLSGTSLAVNTGKKGRSGSTSSVNVKRNSTFSSFKSLGKKKKNSKHVQLKNATFNPKIITSTSGLTSLKKENPSHPSLRKTNSCPNKKLHNRENGRKKRRVISEDFGDKNQVKTYQEAVKFARNGKIASENKKKSKKDKDKLKLVPVYKKQSGPPKSKEDMHLAFLNKLIESIKQDRNNKKRMIDLLRMMEKKNFQSKLLSNEEFMSLLKCKITSSVGVQQLFACKVINKLCKSSKTNKAILIECGVFKIIAVLLTNTVSRMKFQGFNQNILFSKVEVRVLRENLTSVYYFSSLKNKLVMDSKMIESIIKLLKYGKQIIQKKCLKCLCNLCQIKDPLNEQFNPTLFKICKLNAIEPLFNLLKNTDNQKDSLFLLYMLSMYSYAREEIYNKGIFHGFLWLLRNEDEKIQEIALKSISFFVPNNNIHIDCLLLKYGLDLFIQFYSDYLNGEIVSAALKILAHLSEYSRIHLLLLQENVLNSITTRLLDISSSVSLFHSHMIISNLSKYKEGQYELLKHKCYLRLIKSIDFVNMCRMKKEDAKKKPLEGGYTNRLRKELTQSELLLLPKILSRSIANLSSCEETHSELIKKKVIKTLLNMVVKENDRTVIWNVLCVFCNLCKSREDIQNMIAENTGLLKYIKRYSVQKEDEKLLSRAIRCFTVLSKNNNLRPRILDFLNIHEITKISTQVANSEIQLDILKFITNFTYNFKYHVQVIDSNCIKNVIVKLSYFPLPSFNTKVAICLHNLAQNSSLKYILIKSGCRETLDRLQLGATQEIKKICTVAMRCIGNSSTM